MIFGAKTVTYHTSQAAYEERVVLINTFNIKTALELAEQESIRYALSFGDESSYLGYCDIFDTGIDDMEIHGSIEVYSLVRKSKLAPQEYIQYFCATGDESTTLI